MDKFWKVVWALFSASEDDVTMGISSSVDVGCLAIFVDTHEGLGIDCSINGVNGDIDGAFGIVFEADGHG